MRTVLRYKSDVHGKIVRKLIPNIDSLPAPRCGDMVTAEGRPRSVHSRRFHLLGEKKSANYWPKGVVDDGEPLVELTLIG